MDEIMQDERFKHARTDPRFRRMSKKKKKVVISQRFKEMFEDEDFATNYTVDKRGAPVKSKSSDHLRQLYQIEDSEEGGSDGPSNRRVDVVFKGKGASKSKEKQSQVKHSQGKVALEKKKKSRKGALQKKKNDDNSDEDGPDMAGMDLARGRILLSSSSEESGSEVEDESEEEEGEESSSDSETETSEEESEEEEDSSAENVECTTRLAVLNLDWDRMKAVDIFFALNSFKPSTGFIRSVKIYPSEFGLKRLAEEKFGPPELRKDMLNSLAELRARALARCLSHTQPDLPPARLEKRSRRLLKLARRAAAKVMAEDVERGYLDQANTEQRVYDHLHRLVEQCCVFGPEELDQMKDVKAQAPASPTETDPASKSGSKKQQKKRNDEEEKDEKMKEKHREQLRKYQLQRLKYHYAVVECDSAQTAEYIHNQCQGREFESSCVVFNFQVIEGVEVFDQSPTDECHVIPSSYQPNFFLNTALCQVKVENTWDETDRERTKLLTKKLKKREEVEEDDLEQYIASNSDEDYADDDDDGGEQVKDNGMEREMTWDSGLKKVAADLVKKTDNMKNMTIWQQHQEKVKDRRKKKKQEKKKQAMEEAAFSDDAMPGHVDLGDPYFAQELNGKKSSKKKGKKKPKKEDESSEEEKLNNAALELLLMDEEDDNKRHFNLREIEEEEAEAKKKKKKKRGRKQLRKPAAAQEKDDFEVNVQDPRWQALFSDADFNLEPTNPDFKKTKGSKAFIEEKIKRRKRENQAAEEQSRKRLHLS